MSEKVLVGKGLLKALLARIKSAQAEPAPGDDQMLSDLAGIVEEGNSLDARMLAAGMIPVDQMLAGAPLDGFIRHAGVVSLETYRQWLDMECRNFLSMQARLELEKSDGNELYEWVIAHAAVFQSARINFNAAYEGNKADTSGARDHEETLLAEISRLQGALSEANNNDRVAMGYLHEACAIVGAQDFPEMISRLKAMTSLPIEATHPS